MDAFLLKSDFSRLFTLLSEAGYRVLAPALDEGVIRYREVDSIEPLKGLCDEQGPGRYRIQHGDSNRYFDWRNGPDAIKPLTFLPRETLWQSSRHSGLTFTEQPVKGNPTAIIGARACDLAAFSLQRQHFGKAPLEDRWFSKRAEALFIVAVECQSSADTCFCHSTGDGPAIDDGYDLWLHELEEGFLICAGSDPGQQILQQLPTQAVTDEQLHARDGQLQQAIAQQTRQLPEGSLYEALRTRQDAAAWQEIAKRCLSCGNCTAVCPTCFCHSQHDQITADPDVFDHVRQWDSCFNEQHSYIHGIVIRKETKSRYRQWLTHKLGSWHEQYGRSGCVGCGRCITWCPVGIDITETVRQVLEQANAD